MLTRLATDNSSSASSSTTAAASHSGRISNADGAQWIWELVALNFPHAVQIVDWYHAFEYLTPTASALYPYEQEAEAWRERIVKKLWQREIAEVIDICQALQDHPLPDYCLTSGLFYFMIPNSVHKRNVVRKP